MEVRRLSTLDWRALREADRDASAGAVLIDAAGVCEADGTFFRRLESLATPTVAVVSGRCDASGLALLASVSLGFVAEDVTVSVDPPMVLALGLTWSLPAAVGAAPARGLLFASTLDAAALRGSGLAQVGDPEEAAARLAEPGAALLVRSLRVAARSTVDQARAYDDELRRIG